LTVALNTIAVADGGVLADPVSVQRRARRVAVGLGLLWLFSAADVVFTLWAHSYTPFVEGNPLAAKLLASNLYVSIVLLKFVTVLPSHLIFWHLRRYARAEVGLWLIVGFMVWLMLLWSAYTTDALRQRLWVEATHIQSQYGIAE
jgi:hypothetical protein